MHFFGSKSNNSTNTTQLNDSTCSKNPQSGTLPSKGDCNLSIDPVKANKKVNNSIFARGLASPSRVSSKHRDQDSETSIKERLEKELNLKTQENQRLRLELHRKDEFIEVLRNAIREVEKKNEEFSAYIKKLENQLDFFKSIQPNALKQMNPENAMFISPERSNNFYFASHSKVPVNRLSSSAF